MMLLRFPVLTVIFVDDRPADGGVGVVLGGGREVEEESCEGKLNETADWSVDSSNAVKP